MTLRVTDLMIDAVKKKSTKASPKRRGGRKTPPGGWPKTCLPHTAPRCRTCTTITNRSTHFTTGNTCLSMDENAVRAELRAQLRATLDAPRTMEEPLETAA